MNSLGRNRGARYDNALGSMRETLACIDVGTPLGYIEGVDDGLVDRIRKIIGTLVRLVGKWGRGREASRLRPRDFRLRRPFFVIFFASSA